MTQPLVPESFVVPEKLETADFIIRKLTFSDAKLDYEAVMSSVNLIKKNRGGNWPSHDLTFEDDQIDLGWHQREFENKTSFAYTVMSPDEKECLGWAKYKLKDKARLQVMVDEYIKYYNTERPHLGLGLRIPAEVAKSHLF